MIKLGLLNPDLVDLSTAAAARAFVADINILWITNEREITKNPTMDYNNFLCPPKNNR